MKRLVERTCKICNGRFSTLQKNHDFICDDCESNLPIKNLVGRKIVSVDDYKAYGGSNIIITLDDNTHIIAEDGEYGHSVFTIIDNKAYEKLIKEER